MTHDAKRHTVPYLDALFVVGFVVGCIGTYTVGGFGLLLTWVGASCYTAARLTLVLLRERRDDG